MSRRTDRTAPPAIARRAIGRRRLLRDGGLVVSLGALAAACGDDRGGPEEPGRVGVAPPAQPLPEGTVDDVVLLRTAQSIEHTALEVYDAAVGFGVFDAATTTIVERFVDDHTRHSARLGELITAAGGEPYACANPWYMDRAVQPILAAIDDTDDLARDLLQTAHGFESVAGATYQGLVRQIAEPALRREAMLIGADEVRHAATLAMAMTGAPEGYVSPALAGQELEPDAAGIPVPYAIPSTFGQLGTRELVVGARDDEGARFAIILQTPAENSFAYDYLTC